MNAFNAGATGALALRTLEGQRAIVFNQAPRDRQTQA